MLLLLLLLFVTPDDYLYSSCLQDDLEDHVDVTNSRLQVIIYPCLKHFAATWHLIFLKFALIQNSSHSACAKETCNSEQAHQRWLLVHVPAVVGCCHCDPRGHCLAYRQVRVNKRKKLPGTLRPSPGMPPCVLLDRNVQCLKKNIYGGFSRMFPFMS